MTLPGLRVCVLLEPLAWPRDEEGRGGEARGWPLTTSCLASVPGGQGPLRASLPGAFCSISGRYSETRGWPGHPSWGLPGGGLQALRSPGPSGENTFTEFPEGREREKVASPRLQLWLQEGVGSVCGAPFWAEGNQPGRALSPAPRCWRWGWTQALRARSVDPAPWHRPSWVTAAPSQGPWADTGQRPPPGTQPQ